MPKIERGAFEPGDGGGGESGVSGSPWSQFANRLAMHPSRRDDYENVDFYREQVEKQERLAGLR